MSKLDNAGLLEAPMPPPKKADERTYRGRLGKRLRSLRMAAGLSVEGVSQGLKVAGFQINAPAVYAWEQGRSCPSVEVLPTLAKLFDQPSPRDVLPRR